MTENMQAVAEKIAANLPITREEYEAEREDLIEMVFVQGGTFQMGSTSEQKNCYDDEKPVHSVTLSDFYIGKYEVTQKQWRDIMGTNPSNFSRCGDNCPVENVSWDDVQEFLKKLNAKYPGKNYRLPTEAEWEFAARGGTLSKGYEYAGSNDLKEVGWFSENSGYKTHPIGGKKANELGLHDMSGNVWEWCEDDWHDNYGGAPKNGSAWVDDPRGGLRVRRGGSYFSQPRYCRASCRHRYDAACRNDFLGFRLAK